MATVNFVGFETGSTIEAFTTNGTSSIQTSVVRTGTYALRTNPTTTGVGFSAFVGYNASGGVTQLALTNIWTRVYFQYLTKPAASDEIFMYFFNGTAVKLTFRLNSAGTIAAYDTSSTLITTGTTVLSSGIWYRIEALCGTGAAASWELKINGVSEISGTSNLSASTTTQLRLGKVTNSNGNSVDFYYDDLRMSDSAYPGAGGCAILVPNANGTNQTYTIGAGVGSHFQIVNEVPFDGDTSYLLSTSVIGNEETENLTNTGSIGVSGTINSFKAIQIVKNDGVSNGSLSTTIISGGTTTNTAAATISSSYAQKGSIADNDPNTSAAWTLTAIDAVQVGSHEQSNANKSRVTALYGLVDFTPNLFRQSSLDGLGTGGRFFTDPLGA